MQHSLLREREGGGGEKKREKRVKIQSCDNGLSYPNAGQAVQVNAQTI